MSDGYKNKVYLNFPIQLLDGFMLNDKEILDNIMDYAVYANSNNNLEHGNDKERFKASAKYFGISFGNLDKSFENGEALYDSLEPGIPMVGIEKEMLFDYYKNHKTDFQKLCLLAYLGIRSILMNKAYCKTTNNNLLARMSGKSKKLKTKAELIGTDLEKFSTEDKARYHLGKIKTELELNWNLKTYSRYTRGFYVSFKLSLEDLAFHAEKNKKAYREKKLKQEKENARLKALKRLDDSPL